MGESFAWRQVTMRCWLMRTLLDYSWRSSIYVLKDHHSWIFILEARIERWQRCYSCSRMLCVMVSWRVFNLAGKTTLLKILGGKHMVDPDMVRVLGRSAFHDTVLTSSGALAYLGGEVSISASINVFNNKYVFGVCWKLVLWHIWLLVSASKEEKHGK